MVRKIFLTGLLIVALMVIGPTIQVALATDYTEVLKQCYAQCDEKYSWYEISERLACRAGCGAAYLYYVYIK